MVFFILTLTNGWRWMGESACCDEEPDEKNSLAQPLLRSYPDATRLSDILRTNE